MAAVLDLDPRCGAHSPFQNDLYEAADVDHGATTLQKFRFVTWPSLQTLWLTCLILSTLWSLGDFNSVYLLTGGGPLT